MVAIMEFNNYCSLYIVVIGVLQFNAMFVSLIRCINGSSAAVSVQGLHASLSFLVL